MCALGDSYFDYFSKPWLLKLGWAFQSGGLGFAIKLAKCLQARAKSFIALLK